MLTRLLILTACLTATLSLGGCAASERENDPNQVSTIPWNRPQPWEGNSGLGGFNPQTQY
jgi:hypothetical protein